MSSVGTNHKQIPGITKKVFFDSEKVVREVGSMTRLPEWKKGKSWKISLMNLERWRTDTNSGTLDFKRADAHTKAMYAEFKNSLNEMYGPMLKNNVGILSEDDLKTVRIAVAHLGGGRFERVCIYHLDSQSDSENDGELESELQYVLKLADQNCSVNFNPATMTLFFLVEDFSLLRYYGLQLSLAGAEEYDELIEFRNAICSMVTETDILDARLVFAEDGFYRVTLHSPSFEEPIHEVALGKTISTFKQPLLPEVGQLFSGCHVSHAQANGDIHVQFRSYMFELFEFVRRSITMADMERGKELVAGSARLTLDEDTIYLAPLADMFARCKVLSVNLDGANMYFIDYGNTKHKKINDLVPCKLVNKYFGLFHKQAVRAHVVNINRLDVRTLVSKLPFNRLVSVEIGSRTAGRGSPIVLPKNQVTLTAATNDALANIDVILNPLDPIRLSEMAVKEKWAKSWSEPKMISTTRLFADLTVRENVDMKGTNWSDNPNHPVFAQAEAILDVIILSVYGPTKIIIQPYCAEEKVLQLEKGIANSPLYKFFRNPNLPEKIEDFSLPVDTGLFYTLKPQFKIEGKVKEFVRVRVIEVIEKRNLQKDSEIDVLLIDHGIVTSVKAWELLYLEEEFRKLPPQAAILALPNVPEHWTQKQQEICVLTLRDKRFRVKVAAVRYEPKAERCHIVGDIYCGLADGKTDLQCYSVSAMDAIGTVPTDALIFSLDIINNAI